MAKISTNGITVELTVDELVEFMQKQIAKATEPEVKPADLVEPVPIAKKATPAKKPKKTKTLVSPTVETITATEVMDNIDLKRKVEHRVPDAAPDAYNTDVAARLNAHGYKNAVLIRSIVLNATRFMPELTDNEVKDGPTSVEWLLKRDDNTVQVLNVFVAEANAIYRIACKDTEQSFWAPAIGIAFWAIENELGFNTMMSAIELIKKDESLQNELIAAHNSIISAYIVGRLGREKLGTQTRHHLNLETRSIVIKETIEIFLNHLTK